MVEKVGRRLVEDGNLDTLQEFRKIETL